MVVWTAYLKHRARLRGFDLAEIERIVRFSEERYFDVITQRTVVIGRDRKQLLLVAYEQKQETMIPIIVHVTTRQQVMFRLRRGRYQP